MPSEFEFFAPHRRTLDGMNSGRAREQDCLGIDGDSSRATLSRVFGFKRVRPRVAAIANVIAAQIMRSPDCHNRQVAPVDKRRASATIVSLRTGWAWPR